MLTFKFVLEVNMKLLMIQANSLGWIGTILGLQFSICSFAFGQPPSEAELERIRQRTTESIQQNLDEKATRLRRLHNRALLDLLPSMLEHPELFKDLAFSPEQTEKLAAVKEEFSTSRARVLDDRTKDDTAKRDELAHLEVSFRTRICDVLLPFQLDKLVEWNLDRAGLPKLLTNSPVGGILELSERQKEEIRRNADELAKDIREHVHDTRRKAKAAVWDVLDEDQKERLTRLLGEEELERVFSSKNVETIFLHYLYESPSSNDERNGPRFNLRWTDLNSK